MAAALVGLLVAVILVYFYKRICSAKQSLSPKHEALWTSANEAFPEWPLFQRLELTPEDRQAQAAVEKSAKRICRAFTKALGQGDFTKTELQWTWSPEKTNAQ